MIGRIFAQHSVVLAVMAAALFIPAGNWRWPQAWIFLGEFALSSLAISFWLLRHDPALLESRMSAPVQRDQVPWDRVFIRGVIIAPIFWMALIGIDARRAGWSHAPLWINALGALLLALGMAMVWQSFRFNSFAAPQVRVQATRGHHVVSTGPYAVIRHPMYAGALVWLIGMPLLLGSWLGVAALPLFVAGLAFRIRGEERMLRRELTGYDEYASKVRFRLIPGVW